MFYGRKLPVITPKTLRSKLVLSAALDALGPPPPVSFDYVAAVDKSQSGNWGMLGNDRLGDCVPADTGHALMLRTANVGTIVVPTEQNVVDLYSAVAGYNPSDPSTDQGTDENAMCSYDQSTGFLGHKSSAFATVDLGKPDNVRWTVQLMGAIRLGLYVTGSMEKQFAAGQPWTSPSPSDPILGGHDVPIVKYDATHYYVVTWGKLQPVAWDFNLIEEAHAEVFPDWIKQGGLAPSGFDLDQLIADLSALDPGTARA